MMFYRWLEIQKHNNSLDTAITKNSKGKTKNEITEGWAWFCWNNTTVHSSNWQCIWNLLDPNPPKPIVGLHLLPHIWCLQPSTLSWYWHFRLLRQRLNLSVRWKVYYWFFSKESWCSCTNINPALPKINQAEQLIPNQQVFDRLERSKNVT